MEKNNNIPLIILYSVTALLLVIVGVPTLMSKDTNTPVSDLEVVNTDTIPSVKYETMKTEKPTTDHSLSVKYETIKTWKPNSDFNGYGADLLVSVDITKDQIFDLVTKLSLGRDPVNINLYTSRDAYNAGINGTYGDVYNKGFIIFYVKNLTGKGAYSGFNEIRWMQEIGQFADLYGQVSKL